MSSSLTVACVWIKAGHVPFTAEYVVKLFSMVKRHAGRQIRFVCLTDSPAELPKGIETIPARLLPGCRAWWVKLRLFDPAIGLRGRVLYLDLDVAVVAPLAPVMDYPAGFALAPHAGDFKPDGYRVIPRFNSSVMVFTGGEHSDLWRKFRPEIAEDLWGDQDWIAQQAQGAKAMPAEWFPRYSEIARLSGPPAGAKVVLVKKPKNHLAAQECAWLRRAWR